MNDYSWNSSITTSFTAVHMKTPKTLPIALTTSPSILPPQVPPPPVLAPAVPPPLAVRRLFVTSNAWKGHSSSSPPCVIHVLSSRRFTWLSHLVSYERPSNQIAFSLCCHQGVIRFCILEYRQANRPLHHRTSFICYHLSLNHTALSSIVIWITVQSHSFFIFLTRRVHTFLRFRLWIRPTT